MVIPPGKCKITGLQKTTVSAFCKVLICRSPKSDVNNVADGVLVEVITHA